MINFDVKYLDEVKVFLKAIDKKARKKLVDNIDKAKITNDASIFKKLKGTEIWEFRARFQKMQYRLLLFGIQTKRHWSYAHTDLSKKRKRHVEYILKKQNA